VERERDQIAAHGFLGADEIRAGLTGHEYDVETVLVKMHGRIYDPKTGRFLQADPPLVQSPYWSQGLNRYSYVFNNPLSFTDPSGFDDHS
jgi:RHS repeat-associated protein